MRQSVLQNSTLNVGQGRWGYNMCGVVGYFTPITFQTRSKDLLSALTTIAHRGPDACGQWLDEAVGLGLGHVRLSILDLSEAGAQPMVSVSGRYVIVFNGEIYNHLEIRARIEQANATVIWRGHSDTETLLAAIECWGLKKALKQCVGMFAIGLWDKRERILSLARDRFGEKPLYYCWQKGVFGFASELKALRQYLSFDLSIDNDAVCMLLRDGYISAPYTIYNDTFKLLPGHILRVSQADIVADELPPSFPYWNMVSAMRSGSENPFSGSCDDAIYELTERLGQAVQGQMLADVPLGAFLSGGVDSSLVVALMQRQSMMPVKTFAIGFTDAAYDESKYAKGVAKHLGTDHTEWIVTPEEALAVIPGLPRIYDEPFADVSAIPTAILSRVARSQVAVSLSGDAGDELFAGYNRYLGATKAWNMISKLPQNARGIFSSLAQSLEPEKWDAIVDTINQRLPMRMRYKSVGNKLHRFAKAARARDSAEFYEHLTAKWRRPEDVLRCGSLPKLAGVMFLDQQNELSIEAMMMADTVQYLPDDILVKVDRSAMAVSLETRVPMLDHRFAEFAWSLPMSMKVHAGNSKWILKEVLNQFVPSALIDRPKMGFDVPIDRWLRGPLRDWVEVMLDPLSLAQQGIFDAKIVRAMWEVHLSGKRSYHVELWPILMFQAWHEEWM